MRVKASVTLCLGVIRALHRLCSSPITPSNGRTER
jgi:hypothetical protein